MKITQLLIVFLFTLFSAQVAAQEPPAENKRRLSQSERRSSQSERARISAEARQSIESLFERLCPGRCQLVSLNVQMQQPKSVGIVTPGFEAVNGSSFENKAKAINVNLLMDSKLPRNFQSNIPRMIQYQLHRLAPKVLVKPELLNFPEPQLAPMAPYLPEPPQRSWQAPPMADLPPPIEAPIEEPKAAPPVQPLEEEASAMDGIIEALAPWLGPILMVLVLFAFALILVKKMSALGLNASPGDKTSSSAKKTRKLDLNAIKEDFESNRSLRNRVLRKWIDEDQESAADLVRWIGPHILADLQKDQRVEKQLSAISHILSKRSEALSYEDIDRLAAIADTRLVSEKVIFDTSGKSDWEFLEGLGVNNLRRVVQGCTSDERVFILSQLPQSLRAAYLETLSAAARKELILGTSTKLMSKTDASSLAARLRRLSEEFSHIGREADGQALLVLEMVEVLPLEEQRSMLGDLKVSRPEVSQNVLGRLVLETTTLLLPGEIIAEAIYRTPVGTLTGFLRGTSSDVRDYFLKLAPNAKRPALMSELSLELPVGRGEFIAARGELMATLHQLTLRDGFDLRRANERTLMRSAELMDHTQEITG